MADVVENLNALHKEVFADGVPNLVPKYAKVQELVGFNKKKEMGLKYVQPVRLAYPAGFTHALGDGTAGAFSLNDATSGTVKRAEVTAAQILLKDQMDYETAAKASAGGSKSFKEATGFFYEGMQLAIRKRLETELLYGQAGLGVVESYEATGDASVTISAPTWAAGIWAGLVGTTIDVHSANTSTVRGSVQITGVDVENRNLILSAAVTGCVAGDYLYFKGAYGAEMLGIYGILTTASKFGIDGALFDLWKTPSKAITAALTFNDVKSAVAKSVAKGLMEDVELLLNPVTWDNLLTDVSSLRRTDKSEIKKLEIGTEQLSYFTQSGKVSIHAHNMVKQGHAMGLVSPGQYWERLGASDVTFGTPGFNQDMFRQIDGKAGIEARAYSHQCIFTAAPAKSFIITGIVNS